MRSLVLTAETYAKGGPGCSARKSRQGLDFSVPADAALKVWKKGLRFAGSVLGLVEFDAVDEDDSASHTLMEP
jgi:hypothetical protein